MIYACLLVWMHYISWKFKFVLLSPLLDVFQHGQFRSMKKKLNRCIKLRVLRSGFLFLQWGNCCTIVYTQHNPDFLSCMWCGLKPKLLHSAAFCDSLYTVLVIQFSSSEVSVDVHAHVHMQLHVCDHAVHVQQCRSEVNVICVSLVGNVGSGVPLSCRV